MQAMQIIHYELIDFWFLITVINYQTVILFLKHNNYIIFSVSLTCYNVITLYFSKSVGILPVNKNIIFINSTSLA